jgi:hypothetical protein
MSAVGEDLHARTRYGVEGAQTPSLPAEGVGTADGRPKRLQRPREAVLLCFSP